MGVFDGIKVVEASTILAGPLIGTLLADHGADVIKIEHPTGDGLRGYPPFQDGKSLVWKLYSRNKRLVAIDLHEEEGRDLVRKLATKSDVLIMNFRPETVRRWGIGWEEMSKVNPRLVVVNVTGFGVSGIYSGLQAFGALAEGMSGLAHLTGDPRGPPTLSSVAIADTVAAISGAFAVAAALWRREKTGEGEFIDLALYEPLLWISGPHIIQYNQLGTIQTRTGNETPAICPRNIYRSADQKWLVISAATDQVCWRLFAVVGHPEMAEDPRYRENRSRVEHREEVDSLIAAWVSSKNHTEILTLLRDSGVAVAPIYDASDVSRDKHFLERGSIVRLDDPDLGRVTMQGTFPSFLRRPGSVKWAGRSRIGADTDQVLRDLGCSDEQIEKLRARRVVG